MSADPEICQTAPEAPAADAWDERKLAILCELAEAGLEIALALKARIVETAAAEPDAGAATACADLARAFDRASRAVRLSIFLRDRVLKDAARPVVTRDPAHEPRHQRAERVRRIVRRAIRLNFKGDCLREALDRHVSERLQDRDITGDLIDRPIGELVARICADLGMPARWREFAEEAWAQAEITERPPGSPYAAWPELPPDDFDPEDLEPWGPDDDPDDGGEDWGEDWDEDGGGDEPDDPGGARPPNIDRP